MKNELSQEFNSLKEALEIMPKNNKKNKAKYLEYINDKLETYQSLEKNILKEINIRANKIYKSCQEKHSKYSHKVSFPKQAYIQSFQWLIKKYKAYNTDNKRCKCHK